MGAFIVNVAVVSTIGIIIYLKSSIVWKENFK